MRRERGEMRRERGEIRRGRGRRKRTRPSLGPAWSPACVFAHGITAGPFAHGPSPFAIKKAHVEGRPAACVDLKKTQTLIRSVVKCRSDFLEGNPSDCVISEIDWQGQESPDGITGQDNPDGRL
jgi:hypothetical protein